MAERACLIGLPEAAVSRVAAPLVLAVAVIAALSGCMTAGDAVDATIDTMNTAADLGVGGLMY